MKEIKNIFLLCLCAIGVDNVSAQNWTKVYNGYCWNLTIDSKNKYWVHGLTDVYYSSDYGKTWTDANWPLSVVRAGRSLSRGAVSQNNRMIFGALDNGAYITDDYGKNWTQTGPSGFGCQSEAMLKLKTGQVLMTMSGFQRGIYRVDSGSNSWSLVHTISPQGASPDFGDFALDKYGNIYATCYSTNHSNTPGIYKSTNNGSNWSQILSTSYLDNPFQLVYNKDSLYYVNYKGEIFVSLSDTISFHKRATISGVNDPWDFAVTPNGIMYITCGNSGIYISTDRGKNWVRSLLTGVNKYMGINIVKDTLFIGTDVGLYKSLITPTCATGTVTWDGGGSNERFFTKENWVGDLCPCAGADLVFNGTGSNTKHCILDSSLTLGTITLNNTYKGRFRVEKTGVVLTADTLQTSGPNIVLNPETGAAAIAVVSISNNAFFNCASNAGISVNQFNVGLAGYVGFRSKSSVNIGNLHVDQYSQFKGPGDGYIYLTGHLSIANRNTFDGNGATLHFTGTGNQNVDVSSANQIKTIPLVVNKASGAVVLQRNLNTDHLTLTSGNINTGSNRLTLTAPGGLFGGSSSSYINGKVGIDHSSAWPGSKMRLPMGKGSKYRPITLHNTSSTNTWEVEFMDSDPNTLGSANAPLSDISADGYWSANRTAGGGGLLADATYFEISDAGKGAWNNGDLRVALYDGSNWDDRGGSFTSNAVISSNTSLRGNAGYLLALGNNNGVPAPHVLVDGDLVSGKELRTAGSSNTVQVAASLMLSFSVFPNPVAEVLNIALSGADKGSITLSDLSGKVLGLYSAETRSIDMSQFAAGVYFATFSNGSQRITQRVIRQ
jgi:hypothetical protein